MTGEYPLKREIEREREKTRERENMRKIGQGKGYCQLQFSFVNPIISINWLISCCIISLQIETG